MLFATKLIFPLGLLVLWRLHSTAIAFQTTFQFCNGSYTDDCSFCGELKNDGTVSNCYMETQPCFCLDYNGKCQSSNGCVIGEACVKLLVAATEAYCAPCYAIFRRSPLPIFVDDLHDCVPPFPLPTPYPTPSITDDTFESCSDDSDCTGECASVENGGILDYCFSYSDDNCFCVDSIYDTCSTSSACVKGAACVTLKNDTNYYSYCISCDAINRRSPTPQFIDNLHYCNSNSPEIVDFQDTFRYCENGVSDYFCSSECAQLMNDGSVLYCGTNTQPCFCLAPYDKECTSSSECSSGEACVKLLEATTEYYCALCYAIFRRSPLPIFVDDLHDCVPPSPLPTPYPTPSITDDTFESCSDDSDCTGACVSVDDDGVLDNCNSSYDDKCYCVHSAFNVCSTSSECLHGTACVSLRNSTNYSYCISCDAINRRSPAPQFIDSFHYCNSNTPKTVDFHDVFKSCQYEAPDNLCSDACAQLMNDGSATYCSRETQPCFCLDYYREDCTSSSECSSEEACVKLLDAATKYYCAPCHAVYRRSPLPIFVDDLHDCVPPSPLPTPYPTPSITDDTFESCSDTTDCNIRCSSVDWDGDLNYCHSNNDGDCFCFGAINTCGTSNECAFGEACVYFGADGFFRFCASCVGIERRVPKPAFIDDDDVCNKTKEINDPETTGTNDPETTEANDPETTETNDPETIETNDPETTETNVPDPAESEGPNSTESDEPTDENQICISSHHLSHLPPDQLVYASHRRASVLCDQHGNCATPGHIVLFDGSYMMMKTYCDIDASAMCKRRVMSVNSPRMQVGMRLDSNLEGLHFTAMAAKYGTWLEERVVSVILLAGF